MKELLIIGICLLVVFFGPFNIWWNIALLLGIGLFIVIFVLGIAAFVIYATSSAMNFIHEVDKKAKNIGLPRN